MLGACLSRAQKEIKESPHLRKMADVEYAAPKSEKKVLETSLTFANECWEELETQTDTLKKEISKLKLQLSWTKKWVRHVQEKFSLSLRQIPSLVSAKQIHKAIRCPDLEMWDGNSWDNDDNDELEENSDYDLAPELRPSRPLVKTETTDEGGEQARTTVRTVLWSPAELAKWQEKSSRRPEEFEMESVCRVSLARGHQILLDEEEVGGCWGPGSNYY